MSAPFVETGTYLDRILARTAVDLAERKRSFRSKTSKRKRRLGRHKKA
ncbi:MAG: hypothetical protein R2843_15960 [Thermomicrobiales bacterium]